VADAARTAGVPVQEIGRVGPGAGVELHEGGAAIAVDRPGFTHF
jgi:hypothetical protein